MLRIYDCVANAIFYTVACWGSRLRVADANTLKLIYTPSDVVRVDMDSLLAVSEGRMLSKLCAILSSVSHPLQETLAQHIRIPPEVHHTVPQEVISPCGRQTLQLFPWCHTE